MLKSESCYNKLLFSSSLSYMTVSSMLQQLAQRRDLNIVTYLVSALAQNRMLCPPSLQQYIFIHEVIKT